MRIPQLQFFLFVLVLGFLLGPRVIEALQRLGSDGNTIAAVEIGGEKINLSQKSAVAKIEDPYKKLSLRAKSIYVWDVHVHQKLFSVNGDVALPLASVTKIMTALVATESLHPESKITITAADVLGEGDTGLIVGEIWRFDKLLPFTLVASSNDGASAIAEAAGAHMGAGTSTDPVQKKKLFIERMNDRARDIGLLQTSFQNEDGLDLGGGMSGAYGSARDMAMLFEYVFRKYPEIFTPTASAELNFRSENNIIHHVANTNQDVEHIAGMIGSKTGYTDLAGGNLVIIVDIGINHPIIIAVLGSTREDRFSDVKQLIAATIEKITQDNP